MASKTTLQPGSSSETPPPHVANRPRDMVERAVKQASVRAAERKLRQVDLNEAIRTSLPTIPTERAKRAGLRAPR